MILRIPAVGVTNKQVGKRKADRKRSAEFKLFQNLIRITNHHSMKILSVPSKAAVVKHGRWLQVSLWAH